MKKLIFTVFILLQIINAHSQQQAINHNNIKKDLDHLISDIAAYYAYLPQKKVDLDCIKAYYEKQIPTLKNNQETLLLFEYLLDELYDGHVMLNANNPSSYRLYAPIYVKLNGDIPVIVNVWQTQFDNTIQELLGAEIVAVNGVEFCTLIEQFPTHCNDKNDPNVREWIANKVLAGRYKDARLLTLKLKNGQRTPFDLDAIKLRADEGLLSTKIENGIGIIRLNNSLGNNDLITEFDKALDQLMATKGLIIDLRNTVDGGNTYVARGIMGRFIKEQRPYQKHSKMERYDDDPAVERSWIEYVSPRGKTYTQPVVVLVGRWTGSMGEGLAIGFEGMERAAIVGTEMERLAGGMEGFSFDYQNYGYRLSTEKLSHLNGTARELYVPTHYVQQQTTQKDEIFEKGMELIFKKIEK